MLSGGERNRLHLAMTLREEGNVLLLDEPTNGLDIPSKAIFRKVIAGSLDEDQLVIISTHQVKDVENLIDRILLLEKGRFILQEDLYEISSKLHFSLGTKGEGEDILYSEMVPGGFKIITPQANGDSQIDIELLFNAITQGSQEIKDYVNK